jgi:transglutaminase-like putative cysteine protease
MDQSAIDRREITPGAIVAPPPAWVDLAPYPIPATANPHFIAGGACVLLDDSQIDLCGPERAWFYRRAELVTAPAGAERVAQFSVSFDPAFERLEVHRISVIRGPQRIEHAGTALFDILRRESNLERMQFDGRITLHVTLPDVRAGDVVETSFTTYGNRKSLAGRHSAFVSFEWPVGIIDVRVRQRSPAHRRIHERGYCRAPDGKQTEADGVIDRRWTAVERRGVKFEPLSPPWVLQNAALQLSEWRDWAEVVEVFTPLYEETGALPAEIEAEIARINEAETTREGRAAAILRFCQSAVRYLAISMGEGGYTPRALDAIGETRYGDCKDKSKLFVAMARRLGLDACPALVNTRDSYAINTWLPSAQVFDHCIVRLAIDDRVYWLDATRAPQPSPLDKLNQCHFGWALPLRAGVTELEGMAAPSPAHTLETHETVAFGASPDHAVRYEYKMTSRRGRAEWVREQVAREGTVGLFKLYADDIARRFAKAIPLRQDIVSDDATENEITALEVYEILGAWTEQGAKREFSTHDITMRSQLAPLDAGVM